MSARKRCQKLKYRTCTRTTISSFGKLINAVSYPMHLVLKKITQRSFVTTQITAT